METEFYNKYRIKSLDQIVGNKGVVTLLRKYIETKTIPHTLLFSGPSGNGKTSLAIFLAEALGASDDNIEVINCGKAGNVDDARSLIDNHSRKTLLGIPSVIILDEVHETSTKFQNTILNWAENPPSHVYIFMATTAPEKLIKTLGSRGQPIKVSIPTEDELVEYMMGVAYNESMELTSREAHRIAKFADGNLRVLLNALQYFSTVIDSEERAKYLETNGFEEAGKVNIIIEGFFKGNWMLIKDEVSSVTNFEGGRHYIMKYMANTLVGNSSYDQRSHASYVIDLFKEPFYNDKLEREKFINACYLATLQG